MNKDIQTLASQLYSPLFAERDDPTKAYEEMMYHLKGNTEAIVAVHVFMNTIAVEMEKLNDTRRVVVTGKRHEDPEATAEEQAMLYDEYGVNTKNSFNTQP